METVGTLQWEDYLVIAATLCLSIGVGIYYRFSGGRQKTMEVCISLPYNYNFGNNIEFSSDKLCFGQEYFIANKSMNIIPVGIALVVSFMSAITLLGVSAENYTYGTQFAVINLSYLIGTPIVCYGFLPVFFKLQATSAYEVCIIHIVQIITRNYVFKLYLFLL